MADKRPTAKSLPPAKPAAAKKPAAPVKPAAAKPTAKTAAKPAAKPASKPVAKPLAAAKPVSKAPAPIAEARTVKIARPVAANQAVITRNARAPLVAKSAVPLAQKDALIAEAAYYLSESRGFLPGYELADWAEAEQRVNARYRFT